MDRLSFSAKDFQILVTLIRNLVVFNSITNNGSTRNTFKKNFRSTIKKNQFCYGWEPKCIEINEFN